MASDLPIPADPSARLLATRAGPVAVSDEGPAAALPIVCVHGIPGSRRDFRYLAPLLAERFRVLRVEMPGFGESPAGAEASLEGWARLLLAVPEALGLPAFALMSHSFGGGAVLRASARAGDELAGAVLLASMGGRRHRAFGLAPPVYALLRRLVAFPLSRPLVVAAGRSSYRRIGLTPPDGWRDLHRHASLLGSVRFAELGECARRTRAPALVAHCLDDRLVDVAIARELAALLPRGRLVEYPSGGHHLQKSRARELGREVAAFLGSPGPARG